MSAKKTQVKQGRQSQKPTQKHSPRKIVGTILAFLAFLASILVGLFLEWTGVVDFRFWEDEESAAGLTAGTYLVAEGPVQIKWVGSGDAIEATWEPMRYPDLHTYSVQIEGITPQEMTFGWVYSKDQTSAELRPYSRANEHWSDRGTTWKLSDDQEWRVCVAADREEPDGTEIEGSRQCSEVFSLPEY